MWSRITQCIQERGGFARSELLTEINNPTETHQASKRLCVRAAHELKPGGTEATTYQLLRSDATGCSFDGF